MTIAASYGGCDANCRDLVPPFAWHTLPSRNRGGSSFAARVDFGVTIELANFVRVYPEVPRLLDDGDRARFVDIGHIGRGSEFGWHQIGHAARDGRG